MTEEPNNVTHPRAATVISGFCGEIAEAGRQGANRFFNWFDNSGGDADATFVKGHCEFSLYFLLPLIGLLPNMKSKTAVEIGYGGGRLLAAAARFFHTAVGVDIHDRADLVSEELRKRGIRNFELLKASGSSIPVSSNSVHLVYSFIVLQHVTTVSAFNTYLREAWRVLAPGGYAILFFGRLSILSRNTSSRILYRCDQCIEALSVRGYREFPAPVNRTNLRVSLQYATRQARRLGFKLVHHGVSRKLPRVDTYGGQTFVILAK
jgi:ubiquinone/menaquinone biosynthesis C-methylase UbiE